MVRVLCLDKKKRREEIWFCRQIAQNHHTTSCI